VSRELYLYNGLITLVDDEWYEMLSQVRWHAYSPLRRTTYAKFYDKKGGVLMHRVIMDAPKGMEVDHIDRNGLNNTTANLRLCTRIQNTMNRVGRINADSKYKGVVIRKDRKNRMWRAMIGVNKKNLHLGYFANEIDAARAYNEAAIKYYGEFAYLNPIEGGCGVK